MNSTRREELILRATLDKEKYGLVKEHADVIIRLASGYEPILNEGDTLDLSYRFFIEYFGECEKAFNAFSEIFKREDVVKEVNLDELNYGECIIQKLLDRMQELKKSLT